MIDGVLQGAVRRGERWTRSLGRRRDNRAVRALVRLSRSLVRGYDGDAASYDMDVNGEQWLLSRLAPVCSTVFDVGANVGEWTERALHHGADEVHAFEIMPPTAEAFDRRHGGDGRVHLNRVGLGATPTRLTVHYYPDNPALTTTATTYPHDLPHEEVAVEVTTGDRYMSDAGIDRIDLLKIDVEGEEPNVLRGFSEALSRGAIGAIQFEYGVVAALERFLIIDFYEMLGSHGFDIGPLLPDSVGFRDYNLNLERFDFVNWVAVHRDRPDLRRRLTT